MNESAACMKWLNEEEDTYSIRLLREGLIKKGIAQGKQMNKRTKEQITSGQQKEYGTLGCYVSDVG